MKWATHTLCGLTISLCLASATSAAEIEAPPALTTATAVTRPPVIPVAPSSSPAGVTSLNGLTGGLTIAPGANTTVNVNGSTITIDAVSGSGTGSGGLASVTHDASLTGAGTGASPLGLTVPVVVTGYPGIEGRTPSATGQPGSVTDVAAGVMGFGGGDPGVLGYSDTGAGVGGSTGGSSTISWGVLGDNGNSFQPTIGGLGGKYAGVLGTIDFATNTPVYAGVIGVSDLGGVDSGVYGETTGSGVGVYGRASNSSAWAIYGYNSTEDGLAAKFDGSVTINGNLTVNGASYKSFVDPHPTDPSKQIRYVCLEGGEAGTYFRGTARTIGGIARIAVPEDFRMVSSPEGLTVNLTPIAELAVLAVVKEDLDEVVVKSSQDVEFHYVVQGIRRGSENFQPIEENESYVPRSAHDRNFTAHMKPAALSSLKANGMLNSDGSINLETAHRLGWDQRPGWNEAPPEAASAR